jgi:hypothetical protein
MMTGTATANARDMFLAALTARDFARFSEALSPTSQARFLLPRGPEVRAGREEITDRIKGWFAGASEFEVLEAGSEPVGRRHRLNWRFRLSRDGVGREVIEQVAFVDEGPDGISGIDLVCSGFLPDESPVACDVPRPLAG